MKKLLLFVLPIIFAVLAVFVFFQTKKSFNERIAARILDYSGNLDSEVKLGYYHGLEVGVPEEVFEKNVYPVLGVTTSEKWIEVDLSDQKIYAWEGGNLFLQSLVSTGLPWWPTPTGEFNVWLKLRATKMEGGQGKYYYYLPNVPYVMFFENTSVPRWRGFSLHGTYWHNDFGKVHSHGCVNLPTPIAKQLYFWVKPDLSEGKNLVYSIADNPGTRIVIHE